MVSLIQKMPHRPSRTAAVSRRSVSSSVTDISSRPPPPPRGARVRRASRFRPHPRPSPCQPRELKERSWPAVEEAAAAYSSAHDTSSDPPPLLELSSLEQKHLDHSSLHHHQFDSPATLSSSVDLPSTTAASLYDLHQAQAQGLLPGYQDTSALGCPVGEYNLRLSAESKLVSDPSAVLQDVRSVSHVPISERRRS